MQSIQFPICTSTLSTFWARKISKLNGPIKKINTYNSPTSLVPITECPTYFKQSFVNTYTTLDDGPPAREAGYITIAALLRFSAAAAAAEKTKTVNSD